MILLEGSVYFNLVNIFLSLLNFYFLIAKVEKWMILDLKHTEYGMILDLKHTERVNSCQSLSLIFWSSLKLLKNVANNFPSRVYGGCWWSHWFWLHRTFSFLFVANFPSHHFFYVQRGQEVVFSDSSNSTLEDGLGFLLVMRFCLWPHK